jgi:glycosyltransferase involved in cell wall biosynthesis
MKPLLSVITPVYNGERFIAATLESVRKQCHDEIEMVIIDDGSKDRTLDIIHDFSKRFPIKLMTPGKPGSAEVAFNAGLREAEGEWACVLYSDDTWLPGRFERLRSEMNQAPGALILHNAIFIDPEGREVGPSTCPLPAGDVPSELFTERLLIQNFIAAPAPVFRREAALESGGMDTKVWLCPDWDLWLRLGALGPVRFINETLAAYRLQPGSQTVARKRLDRELQWQLTTILDRHLQKWPVDGKRRSSVERAARASIEVNSFLSAKFRREPTKPLALLKTLAAMSPADWPRFFRDSRIVERAGSRLKVQRQIKPEKFEYPQTLNNS